MSAPEPDWIGIAQIARPQGIRGEVIAALLTDFPERFNNLTTVTLKLATGSLIDASLQHARLHNGRIVLKLAGYDTVNRAEELRDATLLIRRDQVVPLPDDNWYDFELVDCAVVTTTGMPLGRVVKVERYGAAPLLVVRTEDSRELMIPFATSICPEVDTAGKRITIDPPAGLLDL